VCCRGNRRVKKSGIKKTILSWRSSLNVESVPTNSKALSSTHTAKKKGKKKNRENNHQRTFQDDNGDRPADLVSS
jgi:hypothetical protein